MKFYFKFIKIIVILTIISCGNSSNLSKNAQNNTRALNSLLDEESSTTIVTLKQDDENEVKDIASILTVTPKDIKANTAEAVKKNSKIESDIAANNGKYKSAKDSGNVSELVQAKIELLVVFKEAKEVATSTEKTLNDTNKAISELGSFIANKRKELEKKQSLIVNFEKELTAKLLYKTQTGELLKQLQAELEHVTAKKAKFELTMKSISACIRKCIDAILAIENKKLMIGQQLHGAASYSELLEKRIHTPQWSSLEEGFKELIDALVDEDLNSCIGKEVNAINVFYLDLKNKLANKETKERRNKGEAGMLLISSSLNGMLKDLELYFKKLWDTQTEITKKIEKQKLADTAALQDYENYAAYKPQAEKVISTVQKSITDAEAALVELNENLIITKTADLNAKATLSRLTQSCKEKGIDLEELS